MTIKTFFFLHKNVHKLTIFLLGKLLSLQQGDFKWNLYPTKKEGLIFCQILPTINITFYVYCIWKEKTFWNRNQVGYLSCTKSNPQFCFKNRKIQIQQDFLLIGNLYMKKQVSCGKELKHQSYYLFFKVQCEQVMN